MKRLLFFLLVMFPFYLTFAQIVHVQVSGVRSDSGKIMVMLTAKDLVKPVYGMCDAHKGTVYIDLKEVPSLKFQISIFHDENSNFNLDMDSEGRPVEGFARKEFEFSSSESKPIQLKLNLYYPSWNK